MRSGITKYTVAAAVLATASALLIPGTASAAAPRGPGSAGEDTAAGNEERPLEKNWAKLHDLTDAPRNCLDNAYVKGCVQPYGDMLWLRDDEWDGIDVRLVWIDNSDPEDPRRGICQDAEGYGDWTRCDKDLPDGHEIKWTTSWWADGEWRLGKAQRIII
ncbi:hypothetical protein [Phytomonospora endophytica]|uniref:Secreted protein n=1 Tax=Phytomonospora endophytica TaxID=714109 RepID=A0A841FP62_9ACTN|nr:hypothetical protein [Phytomonospora endophytica]MBB6037886.1 hypothetical protein [Phytomonospora endophytica]GIG68786.1 hypothetical protein Pen01_50810 [Phytomonospora endophytica]